MHHIEFGKIFTACMLRGVYADLYIIRWNSQIIDCPMLPLMTLTKAKDLSHSQRHRGQQKTSWIFLNICQFVLVQHVQIKKIIKTTKKTIYTDIFLAPVLISFRPWTALAALVQYQA